MSEYSKSQLNLLERCLEEQFLPHLPPLIKHKSVEQDRTKNLSRAFGAFALSKLCKISPCQAAKAVVDDFEDFGIDVLYYYAQENTLYLIQSKLKESKQFSQEEALSFCQGIRKLIKQDFEGFNKNFQNRLAEIEDALDRCDQIQLVLAHTGSGISDHAQRAIQELLQDEDHGEERFESSYCDYDLKRTIEDLQEARSFSTVNKNLWLSAYSAIPSGRKTYFGLISIKDLVEIHNVSGEALYSRNIRNFLGKKTSVNAAIRNTLMQNPADFLFLNNGVTALCEEINPRGRKTENGLKLRKFEIKGLSIINGAQTIASSASFAEENQHDISEAKVFITLIEASRDGNFGKSITRSRNHQNDVATSDFLSLDDQQERLRREILYLDFQYVYKSEDLGGSYAKNRILVSEAASALALFKSDPRFVVWAKKDPASLLKFDSDIYKQLFSDLSAHSLVNAVLFGRYLDQRFDSEINSAQGQEKLAYRHGKYVVGWVLAKCLKREIGGTKIINEECLKSKLSQPLDELRAMFWAETQQFINYSDGPPVTFTKGSLALFRSQTDVLPMLESILIKYFGWNEDDEGIKDKRSRQVTNQPYSQDLFNYLITKAPQIEGLYV